MRSGEIAVSALIFLLMGKGSTQTIGIFIATISNNRYSNSMILLLGVYSF